MLRILTALVLFHWAALFSLLAFICVLAGDDGATQALRLMGVTVGPNPIFPVSAPAATATLSLAFAISAVLFWWGLLTTTLSSGTAWRQHDDVLGMAFVSASAALTVVLLYGATQDFGGLFGAVALHFCALLASHVALAPRASAEAAGVPNEEKLMQVRDMASHAASLARFTARPTIIGSEAV